MAQKHLLLIHGFLEDATMWNALPPKTFSRSVKIHTPELLGHGTRPMINNPGIKDYAVDILSQLQIPTEDAVVVVGHSMGGYVAIEVMKLLGESAHALCLFHSTGREDSETKKADRLRAFDAATQNKELYNRTVITSLFHEKKKEVLREQIENNIAIANRMSVEAITSSIMAMRDRQDHIETLKQRSYPLFYFLGDNDSRLPLTEMMEEINQLPGCVYEIAENTGHMGHMECPVEVALFLQRIVRAEMG